MGRLSWTSVGAGGWAVATWLLCLPVAFLLPGLINQSPFTLRGSATPIVVGAVLLLAGVCAARRWRGGGLAGISAGLFAGWVVLAMHTGLHGTPYGFVDDDTWRLAAMAERYTTTVHSADGIVAAVPSEYPPLFPWLVGQASVLVDVPAWRLLGTAETLMTSGVIVVAFLLWRRMCSDWVALAVSLLNFVVFLQPAKPYEVMALAVVVPWALATFAEHPGRRLGWLPAGIVGGLVITLYQGYLMFLAVGIVALIALTWRASTSRRDYALHVGAVAMVAFIVSSWYLVPYLGWGLAHGLEMTDRFKDPLIAMNPFPFLSLTPIGVLTAVGLLGILWYRGRAWWAVPLGLLTLSAYAYRLVAEVEFTRTGQTLVFQYTVHAVIAALAAAGVLTVARALPALQRRLSGTSPVTSGTLAIALVVLWAGIGGWYDWMPGVPPAPGRTFTPALTSGYQASNSFLQPLPNGRYPRYAPTEGRFAWFPTAPIVRDVRSVLGANAAPVTLSWSEQLYATQPWPGFIGVGANAAASTEEWFSRVAELKALSRITDPVAFARASVRTPYGPIDAFVLHVEGEVWQWTANNYPATVSFRPAQFANSTFATFSNLADGTVLVVRRANGERPRQDSNLRPTA